MAVGVDYSLFYVKREREESAAGREGARRAAARGCDLGAGRAGLGLHRADRDGRAAARRLEDLHLARDRRDDRRLHVDGRVADGAARAARPSSATGSTAACSPSLAAGILRGAAPSSRACCVAAHRRTHAATTQGRRGSESRIWAAVLRPSLRHPVLAAVGSAAMLDRARAAGVRHALEADRLRRPPGAASRSCRPTKASSTRSPARRARRRSSFTRPTSAPRRRRRRSPTCGDERSRRG